MNAEIEIGDAFAPLEAMALLGSWDRGELVSQTAATEAVHLRLAGEIWLAADADDVPAARAAIVEILRLIDSGKVRLVAVGEIAGRVKKTIDRARAAVAEPEQNEWHEGTFTAGDVLVLKTPDGARVGEVVELDADVWAGVHWRDEDYFVFSEIFPSIDMAKRWVENEVRARESAGGGVVNEAA